MLTQVRVRKPTHLAELNWFCQEEWLRIQPDDSQKLVHGHQKHLSEVKMVNLMVNLSTKSCASCAPFCNSPSHQHDPFKCTGMNTHTFTHILPPYQISARLCGPTNWPNEQPIELLVVARIKNKNTVGPYRLIQLWGVANKTKYLNNWKGFFFSTGDGWLWNKCVSYDLIQLNSKT